MWLLILLFLCGNAYADVYVTVNSQGNVYDISNMPDAVVPTGYTRTILKGQDISNLQIVQPYQNYNFANGNFTLNSTAVQAQQAAQATAIAAQTASATAKQLNQQLRQQRDAYIDALISGNTTAQQAIVATEPALVTQAANAQAAATTAQGAVTSTGAMHN